MNLTRTASLALATLVLCLGTAQGIAPPTSCGGTCTITAASTGYMMPVTTVASGEDVVWHSTDVSHVQRETSTPVGSPAACFNVNAPGSGDSAAVTFAISGGALEATVGSTTTTCANAVEAGGNFVVPYHCTLHPTMRGVLVVTP
ncbi:MAG: cupredoxin domain-containing protein [Thermoplasmatota archaeon]